MKGFEMGKRLTTKGWIERAVAVHGDKYDYSLVEYKNRRTKVNVVCSTHGNFEIFPESHISGTGCRDCSKYGKDTSDSFIEKARKIHGDKYDYSLTKYTGSQKKVKIICSIHGVFTQRPNNHLGGQGCNVCKNSFKKDTKEAIKGFKKVHGNKYDYSLVEYNGNKEYVTIVCDTHGNFRQRPNNHLGGQGCPSCSTHGFDSEKPAILYYLKVTDGENVAYKIGITNRSVCERYNLDDLSKIEVLMELDYAVGRNAYKREQEILKEFKSEKWDGVDLLKKGNTELFKIDVLGLDK